MASPLYTIRQLLARQMGETIVGVPVDNFATNAFGVTRLATFEDDYFNDRYGRFYSGVARDTDYIVTDFVKTNGVITFAPALSAAVTATDLFEIYQKDFTAQEFIDAINSAIDMVKDEALEDVVETSIELVSKVFEYDIPESFAYIDDVFKDSTAGKFELQDDRVDQRHWGILRNGSGSKLWLDANYFSITAGRHLRLVGQGAPPELLLDTDVSRVNRTFVVYQAKALLHQSRIRGQGADSEGHRAQMVLSQNLANSERKALLARSRGRKVLF